MPRLRPVIDTRLLIMQQIATTESDAALIQQIIAGNADVFETLLKRYEQPVLRILKRHLPYDQVEETAQEVFVKVYQSLPGFKQTGSFKHWLSSIAVRTCYDFWRKHYRNREMPMSSLTEAQAEWLEKTLSNDAEIDHENLGRRKEAREVLEEALGRLSAEDRMVLELVYLEGLTGKEAASLLGWSVANVKVRTFRSRKKLEKILIGLARHEEDR
ncbi:MULTISPECIES: RNA polymerase sigma factor [Desulfococcus]|uniref:RNA polymerase, sigma-24 subunit, ECF subfamily n=1 Tax=Desulfococcus multivorans DSM 2059 TaxID=1121405 RepID=S7V888_DESML|nr:RNA polymerase sigma factor [Desulfococcus multivorans]AOY59443.1 RpoE: RNA polymerase sigma-E factor (sigma24) [Desulfococcus multivorans]AQV03042.2 RNA polymerase subunit sigma-24 [Desulfococcus multivorans]EPR42864.1 RNA polymerase, sigma-24 subunit, ECF subfamily [Desulfococcus multivorans DSM 2059]MDX9818936.1 RNA polymerase sigma factor [Desulfococcus multivorans]SKA00872.1 RNA polymerase sigma-70 factor, ECF subfamily [Desulfococcus multivorans DSM 2059]